MSSNSSSIRNKHSSNPRDSSNQTEDNQNSSKNTKRSVIHARTTPKRLPNGYTDYGYLNREDTIRDPYSFVFTAMFAKEPSFPIKLHRILCRKQNEGIIRWLPHGRSWIVLDIKAFEEKVIPNFFHHGKYSSFMRQVNGWGFKRISKGPDSRSYCHELFLKGLPHVSLNMNRPTTPEKDNRSSSSKSGFSAISAISHSRSPPNFYDESMYCSLPEYDDLSKNDTSLSAESMSVAIDQMSESSGKGCSPFMTRPTGQNIESNIANVASSSSTPLSTSANSAANLESLRFPDMNLQQSIMFPRDVPVPSLSHNESIFRQELLTSMNMRQDRLRNLLGLAENRFQLPMQNYGDPTGLYGLPLNNLNGYTTNPLLGDIQRSLALTDHIKNRAVILAERQREAAMLAALQRENEVLRSLLRKSSSEKSENP